MKVTIKDPTPGLSCKLDAWWLAANCLSAGQMSFYDNPLLGHAPKLAHIKPRLGQQKRQSETVYAACLRLRR